MGEIVHHRAEVVVRMRDLVRLPERPHFQHPQCRRQRKRALPLVSHHPGSHPVLILRREAEQDGTRCRRKSATAIASPTPRCRQLHTGHSNLSTEVARSWLFSGNRGKKAAHHFTGPVTGGGKVVGVCLAPPDTLCRRVQQHPRHPCQQQGSMHTCMGETDDPLGEPRLGRSRPHRWRQKKWRL